MSVEILFALLCAAAALVYGGVSVKWILGKPAGREQAATMLRGLSGRAHEV